MGHFRDCPVGNHLQKSTAKSIKPTQKNLKTIIYYLHTHAHQRNTK